MSNEVLPLNAGVFFRTDPDGIPSVTLAFSFFFGDEASNKLNSDRIFLPSHVYRDKNCCGDLSPARDLS